MSGTGTTSPNFISILSNLTNVGFFSLKKISLKGGHLLVQKVQKPDPPTENTLVEMFRFCLDSDQKKTYMYFLNIKMFIQISFFK